MNRIRLIFSCVLFSLIISLATIFTNSLLYIFLGSFLTLNSILDISLSGVTEEFIRAIFGATIFGKVITVKKTFNKTTMVKLSLIFTAIIFTALEKGKIISDMFFDFRYENHEPNIANVAPYLIIVLSIVFHAIIHYYLFKISIYSAIQKRWFFLISICIFHGIINLIMVYIIFFENMYLNVVNVVVKLLILSVLALIARNNTLLFKSV